MRKAITFLLPLLAGACAAGPDYQPPATPAASGEAFVTTTSATDPTLPLPDAWWRLYDDPALDRLITRAFATNTDLRVAMANLARARAVLGEARAGRLPSTDVSGSISYGDGFQGGFSQGGGNTQWTYSGDLSVAWEADLFGRVTRTIEAARADTQAIEAARDKVRVTVAAETARLYTNACYFAQAAANARTALATAENSLRLVTAQERARSVGRFEEIGREHVCTPVTNEPLVCRLLHEKTKQK